jgi:hypothetical protein
MPEEKAAGRLTGAAGPRFLTAMSLPSEESVPGNPRGPVRPAGHVLVPAAAIGSLSILLAAGLTALGILDRMNGLIADLLLQDGQEKFPKALPDGSVWLATVLFAFGLSFAILSVAGTWRRIVLWITTAVLVAAWAPVLSLAAHAPEISAPFIAVLWSGVCALVYAGRHRMACDETPLSPS